MKKWIFILFSLATIISCGTVPPPNEVTPSPAPQADSPGPVPPAAPQQEEIVVYPEEEAFDPVNISQEMYDTAKADIQALIGDLNRIIRAKNYNAWTDHLADSYLRVISSRVFLEERTEELYRRDQMIAASLGRDPKQVQKKILRTARDYFENVVVPSRSNDHLDDIDFVSDNRVKAYTLDNRGNRLILYDLEIIDNKWKIIG